MSPGSRSRAQGNTIACAVCEELRTGEGGSVPYVEAMMAHAGPTGILGVAILRLKNMETL